jgi:hypothetical protein
MRCAYPPYIVVPEWYVGWISVAHPPRSNREVISGQFLRWSNCEMWDLTEKTMGVRCATVSDVLIEFLGTDDLSPV